jgi:signal transduction histidine kinase/DNA-binding response OmpR family regulator/HPt (histidine-containing phosphotransfer) domain-containing protein
VSVAGDPVAEARAEFAAGLGRRLETMRQSIAALHREFRPDEVEALYRAAHALRGTAASYGTESVASAAATLETLAQAARQGGALAADPAAAALEQLEAAVRSYLAELAAAAPDAALERLAVVGHLARLINTRFDLRELFRSAILEVRRVLDFRRASVVLTRPARAEYYLHTLFDSLRGGFVESDAVFPIDQGLTGEAIRTGRALRIDALPGLDGILAREGQHVSAMIIPLRAGGEIIGSLNFGHEQTGFYRDQDLAWATVIGQQVETAFHYSRLFSTIDRQRHELESLIETSEVAIMLVGVDGKVAHANRRMAHLVGIPLDALAHADIANVHALLQGSFADPSALDPQRRALGGDDRLRDRVELQFPAPGIYARVVAPVRDAGGASIGHLIVYRNVTQEADAERLKSEFVSIVSHELRTPMTSVKASLSLVLAGASGPVDPAVAELLEIALRNTDRLVRLVNDLLDLSRLEAGRLELRPEPTPLDEVVRLSVETVGGVATEQKVKVVATAPATPVTVLGVRDRLVQVAVNLLANAIKFSPPGTRVEIRWWQDGADGVLEVADQGPGIPPDKVSVIFEPFRQLDSSTTRERGGAGLGLAITKGIVDALGGSVRVESDVGRGSRFLVRLPIAGSPVLAAELRPVASAMALVVHRDADWRRLVAARLQADGLRVSDAAGAQQALETLSTVAVDVLVTSLELADVHGLELLERLGADPRTFDVRTIVVAEDDGDAALRHGAAAWTTSDVEEVVRIAHRVLAAPRRARLFVVEDDPGMRRALAQTLRRAGYACFVSADASGTVAALRERRPDLLITDFRMAGIDGLTLLRTVRGDAELARLPVLLISGHTGPELAREARRLSARLLLKPVEADQLLQTVRELV